MCQRWSTQESGFTLPIGIARRPVGVLKHIYALFGLLVIGLVISACSVPTGASPQVRPTSGAHADELFLACTEAEGWTAEIDPRDGGVIAEYPAAQNDKYLEDSEQCAREIGTFDPPELTREQYGQIYGALVEASSCLTELGYDVPSAPSLAVFIETKAQWSPFAQLPQMGMDEFDEAVAQCPQPQIW